MKRRSAVCLLTSLTPRQGMLTGLRWMNGRFERLLRRMKEHGLGSELGNGHESHREAEILVGMVFHLLIVTLAQKGRLSQ